MHILVIGGAGYIGSHMVVRLLEEGYHVTVVDDLSNGHTESVVGAKLHVFDFGEKDKLTILFKNNNFHVVMHFASSILVEESRKNPSKYYQNNVSSSITLFDTMIEFGVKYIIFSSTAAIFGNPLHTPINEQHPTNPINPYGQSKLFVEKILEDYDSAYQLKSVALRYFNAAGADPKIRMGENHKIETHLIPLLLQVACERRPDISVFGRDHPTPDGTCIRDYIHVMDLCSAHLQALHYLIRDNKSDRFNLGNGVGYSVQEVILAVETITKKKIKIVETSKRLGDPACLVADASKAKKILGWNLVFPKLETIIEHAFAWEKTRL